MKQILSNDQFKLEVIQFVQKIQSDLPRLCNRKPTNPVSQGPLQDFKQWLPEILNWYKDCGFSSNFTAAHGRGHIIRDVLNTLIMLPGTPMHPDDALAAAIAGLTHDLAVGTYNCAEKNNIGHADIGGYLLRLCLRHIGFTAKNPYAAGMAVFSAAAHTFYTEDRTVLVGGQEYKLAPYPTLAPNGEVLVASDVTKGIDQADCVSGFFVGRYLINIWDVINYVFINQLGVIKYVDGQFPTGSALRHFTALANNQLTHSQLNRYHYGDVRRVLTTYAPWLMEIINEIYNRFITGNTGGESYQLAVEKWLVEKVTYFDGLNEAKVVMYNLMNLDEPLKTAWLKGLNLAREHTRAQIRFMRQELGDERIAQLPKNLPILGSGLHDMLAT